MSLAAVEAEVLRPSSTDRIDPAWISAPEADHLSNPDGQDVHAFYYAPKNPDVAAPAGERPPLLVLSHGGPTGAASDVLDAAHPVLDQPRLRGARRELRRQHRLRPRVSRPPEGPVGHRRRRRLRRTARGISSAPGKADPDRLIIRGGSAGGYTTLAALTFHDTFKAGASYYGISDIEVLARDTHKFESRYLDSLDRPVSGRARSLSSNARRFTSPIVCRAR